MVRCTPYERVSIPAVEVERQRDRDGKSENAGTGDIGRTSIIGPIIKPCG